MPPKHITWLEPDATIRRELARLSREFPFYNQSYHIPGYGLWRGVGRGLGVGVVLGVGVAVTVGVALGAIVAVAVAVAVGVALTPTVAVAVAVGVGEAPQGLTGQWKISNEFNGVTPSLA